MVFAECGNLKIDSQSIFSNRKGKNMLKIIKWFFYGFIFVFLWQISQTLDDNREQISDATLRLSNNLENSANEIIKQSQKNISDTQQNLADSIKQASKQYIKEIMK